MVVKELAIGVADVLGERVIGDRLGSGFWQFQLAGDRLDQLRRPLAAQERLLDVAEDDLADLFLFELGVVLEGEAGPAVVLAELGRHFLHHRRAVRDVGDAGGFLDQAPLQEMPGQRFDVLATGVADEVVGRRLHRRLPTAEEGQLEQGQLVLQGNVRHPVEELPLRPFVPGPIGKLLGQVLDRPPVMFRHRGAPHHLDQDRMGRHLFGSEPGEEAVADHFFGGGGLQELGDLVFVGGTKRCLPLVGVRRLMSVDPGVEEGGACLHPLMPAGGSQGFPGDFDQLVGMEPCPVLKRVGIELIDIPGEEGEPEPLGVFVGRGADHVGAERGGLRLLALGEGESLGIEVVEGFLSIRPNYLGTETECLGEGGVAEPFLDDEIIDVAVISLAEEGFKEGGLPGAGHAEEEAVLRLALDVGLDSDHGSVCAGVEDLRAGEMAGERRGKRQHRRQVDVLEILGLMGIFPEDRSRPGLEPELLVGRKGEGLVFLAAIEPVDDGAEDLGLVGKFLGGLGPDANDEVRVVGMDRAPFDRLDPLLDHRHRLQKFGIAGRGVIAPDAAELFLLLADDLVLIGGIEIGGDRVVEEVGLGKEKDRVRIGAVRQPPQGQNVPIEAVVAESVGGEMAFPGVESSPQPVFLQGIVGIEFRQGVISFPRGVGWIEIIKPLPEMPLIIQGREPDVARGEEIGQARLEELEFPDVFAEELPVIGVPVLRGGKDGRSDGDLLRDVEMEVFPAQLPPLHRVVKLEEGGGADLPGIGVGAELLRLPGVFDQFVLVVGIDRPAELHPVLAAQAMEEAAHLSVEIGIELIRGIGPVGAFDNEPLAHHGGDEGIEAVPVDEQPVLEESVGAFSGHGPSRRVQVGFSNRRTKRCR